MFTSILKVNRLWKYISKKSRTALLLSFFLMIISAACEASSVFLLAKILSLINIDSEINKLKDFLNRNFIFLGEENAFLFLLISIVFIFTIFCLIKVFNCFYNLRVSALIGNELSYKAYKKNLYSPYIQFKKNNTSKTLANVTSINGKVVSSLKFYLNFYLNLLISISVCFTLIWLTPVPTLISLILISAFYIIISNNVNKILKRNSNYIPILMESIMQNIQEGLGSIKDTILDANHENAANKFKKVDLSLRKKLSNNEFLGEAPKYMLETLIFTCLVIYGLISSNAQLNSISLLGAFALGAQKLLPSIQNIYRSISMLKSYGGALDYTLDCLNKKDESFLYKRYIGESLKPKLIHLESVSFSYNDSGRNTIQDINLKIKQGQKIGIFGTTGSGKSTLLDILMGLIKPNSGRIYIDGYDLYTRNPKAINLISWRKSIALVPQNIYLSDATIVSNIALNDNDKEIDQKRIKKLLKICQLEEFIFNNQSGLNTIVGDRGVNLSGGQVQRIGICRALYKNLPILILDEATSALDSKTEKILLESIMKAKPNIIIIMVAHRLSTLKDCDYVINLEGGIIKEYGEPQKILKQYI